MSDPMDAQEIAEASQEFGEPLCFEDWQACNFAKETVSQAYYEASEELQLQLIDVAPTDTMERHRLEALAYGAIDCKMDEEYQCYRSMHPHTLGYLTETYSNIYPDGGL